MIDNKTKQIEELNDISAKLAGYDFFNQGRFIIINTKIEQYFFMYAWIEINFLDTKTNRCCNSGAVFHVFKDHEVYIYYDENNDTLLIDELDDKISNNRLYYFDRILYDLDTGYIKEFSKIM